MIKQKSIIRRTISQALYIALIAVLMFSAVSCSEKRRQGDKLNGDISISGAFALYPLAIQWGNEFHSQHPGVRVSVSAGGAGKGMTDVMNGMVDYGMLSRELYPEEKEKGATAFTVGKDAVVATINSENPLLQIICARGLTAEMAYKAWGSGECKTWGDLLGTDDKEPLHVYTRSDACGAAQVWASYAGIRQEDMKGTAVYGDPGIANAVRGDKYGLGFNNIAYAYNPETLFPAEGLTIFPLDVDNNGVVTQEEMFYRTRKDVIKAVEDGVYPTPPSRKLYLVSKGVPSDTAALAFMKYVLKAGQKFNEPAGYVKVTGREVSEQMRVIRNASKERVNVLKVDNTSNVALIFIAIIFLLLCVFSPLWFIKSYNDKRIYKEKISSFFMFLLTIGALLLVIGMMFGFYYKCSPLFENNSLWDLLTSAEWKPSKKQFGFRPFIVGTLSVTALSMLIAVPLSLMTAIYLTEYSHTRVKKFVFPSLDILAALPSVIFGLWGILLIMPVFGYSLMTSSIVLCVMVLPILVSLFIEIFSAVPQDLRDASTSLGATKWQTTKNVVLKKSVPGIFAAVVLALSKAMGETIAVMMVCGCVAEIPKSLTDGFYTLPALIGNNYGEMSSVPLYESAIMFSALILFVIVLIFNVLSRVILYRISKN